MLLLCQAKLKKTFNINLQIFYDYVIRQFFFSFGGEVIHERMKQANVCKRLGAGRLKHNLLTSRHIELGPCLSIKVLVTVMRGLLDNFFSDMVDINFLLFCSTVEKLTN